MDEVEAVVVGAGVVGLAAARALALAGHEVIVLEKAYTIGFETSSRNSEVIHGGLYYPKGSLKATACVEGRQRLYAYCREHGVPHARLGKLIVATSEDEIPGVEKIEAAAKANGVDNLEWLQRRRGAAAGAGAALRRGAAVAVDRDHRQPCADAGLSGRRRGRPARWSRSRRRCSAGRVRGDGFELDGRRRRADDDPLPLSGQRRRAVCAGAGARDRGHPARHDPAGLFLPRLLFHADRQDAVHAG